MRIRSFLLTSAAVAALTLGATVLSDIAGNDLSSAEAAQGQGQGKQMGKGQGGAGRGGGQGAGQGLGQGPGGGTGSSMEEDIMRGQRGGGSDVTHEDDAHSVDEESDKPDWAGRDATGDKLGGGNKGGVTEKGSLYGDLWIILRDENGAPVLNEEGYPQPIDAEGDPIPLDDEGHPLDESLVQEVELGRLNVGRSPAKVTDRALGEALATLNAAEDVDRDAAGRLMVLVDGEWKTIDSPIENLALYIDLIQDGTISGLDNTTVSSSFSNLSDGQFTDADYSDAATFLAAAADKTGTVTLDEVVYLNNILGLNDVAAGNYLDLTSVSYTRSATFAGVTADVLVDANGDGTWETETVDVYNEVFGGIDTSASAAEGFAQAVDDARAVVNFIHEYEVPADSFEDASH